MGTILTIAGKSIEINDTLQITKKQGFPGELIVESHLKKPFTADQFAGQTFSFNGKPGERRFQEPPIRNFLVENRDGKWIYWGLIHVFAVEYDADKNLTSGKFKIIYIYTPDEMEMAHGMIDRNSETDFFKE